MNTLNYITGREAVEIFDNDFEEFLHYAEEENPECFQTKEFNTEEERKAFVDGLEVGGYENYSILDEEQAKKVLAAIY